ncbi:GNAT family N-acetyltransferase [Pontibacter sp. E15-1]|uniref:GNAT family N-acetyltransferase n=1 Tax=Pontibacter sp. E15-1 TaxID=2919918 RepID=UPI001F4FFFB8|nr:GNAT family N-acetyltransferase [Pontibacter sp. E15-1]MCJ8166998.1 GNAT family N-acetyltransferase [Pontibacter sp. E15-1]
MTYPDSEVFSFRAGSPQDAELLADLGWRTFKEAFGTANKSDDMAAFRHTMYGVALQAAELADPTTAFVIAEVEDEAVGYLKLNSKPAPQAIQAQRPLQIDRLYITRTWTGSGLGDLFMELCLQQAKQHERDVVWLTVWEHNARAIRFYQKYGFREVGELDFILGKDVQRDVYMQREV